MISERVENNRDFKQITTKMEIENYKDLDAFLEQELIFDNGRLKTQLTKTDLMRLMHRCPKLLQSKGKTKEEVLEEHVDPHCFARKGCIEAIYEAMEEYAQSHANKDGWVSCAERLPEKHQEVLFFLKKTDENGLQHDAIVKDWTLSNGEGGVCLKDDRATHWMPLPPKPQT